MFRSGYGHRACEKSTGRAGGFDAVASVVNGPTRWKEKYSSAIDQKKVASRPDLKLRTRNRIAYDGNFYIQISH